MAPPAAWEIYQRELLTFGLGLPLWNPQPLPGLPEIQCGSVVCFDSNAFGNVTPLFNTLPRQQAPEGLPEVEDFKYLELPPNTLIPYSPIKTDSLSSRSVTIKEGSIQAEGGSTAGPAPVTAGAGFSFKCSESSGALLKLGSTPVSMHIQAKLRIVSYMKEHFDSWMRFANDNRALGIDEDELYFVSGTTKTTSWFVAAFENCDYSDKEVYVSFNIANVASASVSMTIDNKHLSRTGLWNYGPTSDDMGNVAMRGLLIAQSPGPTAMSPPPALQADQCVFIHYYKMRRRMFWRAPMKAAAGPHVILTGRRDDEDEDGGRGMRSQSEDMGSDYADPVEYPLGQKNTVDPVEPLLNYILENSVAEIAIACDRDLLVIFQGQEIPSDIPEGLAALRPPIEVDKDGVGTFLVDVRVPESLEDVEEADVRVEHDATAQPGGANNVMPESLDKPQDGDEEHGDLKLPVMGGVGWITRMAAHRRAAQGSATPRRAAQGSATPRRAAQGSATSAHASVVMSMAVSPNSRWAASGSDDSSIILWDIYHAIFARTWDSLQDTIWALSFSPNSTILASAGSEHMVHLWDIANGTRVATLSGHTDTIQNVVWSPDSMRLATCSVDCTIRIWDVGKRTTLHTLEGHTDPVSFVRFSPDGRRLASGSADCTARVWDVQTGALLHELRGHEGMVWTGVFDPPGARLATGSEDGTVRVWNVETGDELVTLHEHHGPVWDVSFSQDNTEVLSASRDATARVCTSFTGERLLSLEGHDSAVNAAAFSPDKEYIATASRDSTVKLWKRSDGTRVKTFNEHNDNVTRVAFTPDREHLVSGSDDGTVCMRRLRDYL